MRAIANKSGGRFMKFLFSSGFSSK
jgi:hypothetical protein